MSDAEKPAFAWRADEPSDEELEAIAAQERASVTPLSDARANEVARLFGASDEPRGIEMIPKIEKGPRETPNPSRVPYHAEKEPASDEPRDWRKDQRPNEPRWCSKCGGWASHMTVDHSEGVDRRIRIELLATREAAPILEAVLAEAARQDAANEPDSGFWQLRGSVSEWSIVEVARAFRKARRLSKEGA